MNQQTHRFPENCHGVKTFDLYPIRCSALIVWHLPVHIIFNVRYIFTNSPSIVQGVFPQVSQRSRMLTRERAWVGLEGPCKSSNPWGSSYACTALATVRKMDFRCGRNTLMRRMSRSLWGKTMALNQPLPGRTIIEINFISEVCRG